MTIPTKISIYKDVMTFRVITSFLFYVNDCLWNSFEVAFLSDYLG